MIAQFQGNPYSLFTLQPKMSAARSELGSLTAIVLLFIKAQASHLWLCPTATMKSQTSDLNMIRLHSQRGEIRIQSLFHLVPYINIH